VVFRAEPRSTPAHPAWVAVAVGSPRRSCQASEAGDRQCSVAHKLATKKNKRETGCRIFDDTAPRPVSACNLELEKSIVWTNTNFKHDDSRGIPRPLRLAYMDLSHLPAWRIYSGCFSEHDLTGGEISARGNMTNRLRFLIVVLISATACLAQDGLAVQSKGKQKWPAAEAQKIYLSACSVVQREFGSNRPVAPPSHAGSGCRQKRSIVSRTRNRPYQMGLLRLRPGSRMVGLCGSHAIAEEVGDSKAGCELGGCNRRRRATQKIARHPARGDLRKAALEL
jgi:hypothetical protein